MELIHQMQLLKDNRPATFIRYNPHTFLKNGLKQLVSASDENQAQQAKRAREKKLVQAIKQAQFGMTGSLRVMYMFYTCYLPLLPAEDDHTYCPIIWLNPAYSKDIRRICMPVIV